MRRIFLLLAMFLFSQLSFANVERGISGREVGDIIALGKDDEIMKYCDFDKQIVVTQLNVLCVYKENKTGKNGVHIKFGT